MTQLQTWIDLLDQTNEEPNLKAEFQVVTPMFIGDGEQKADSIRPPAIKGALRFWWRALNWSRCLQQAGNEASALKQLHDEEAVLFGLAAKQDAQGNQTGGQGVFSLKLTQKLELLKDWSPGAGIQYLLGQGLWNYKEKLLRNAIADGSCFTIELRWHPNRLDIAASKLVLNVSSIKETIDDALMAFGLLSGLGSRARKGLGAVSITALSGSRWSVPTSMKSYKETLQKLLQPRLSTRVLPPFTAVSANTRLDFSSTGKAANALLEEMGGQMQMYRSWGREGKVNGKSAEQNFRGDHDEALFATQGEQPRKQPERAVFGLPHNYFFSSTKGKVDIHVKKDAAGERRASPLFLHTHLLPDGSFVAVQLLMPAVFLPGNNPMLEYKSKRSFTLPASDADWSVITRYMDRFKNKETVITTDLQGAQ
ncbi:type III-B CRISPR module RAMP protein Cmr1 [Marinobacterium iners]|uniref:type III-B CRISPR module RAMP protein Cmr1 n=1 Tax=Marinobacterium iners TaxID=48076 RepID=UPI001A90337A|nr:type III-B CRISPR module RAMP protein Cmr1 [Marinobacterium iners]QSR34165.1 type III-B CRISPR module RAMP protein Cmr1 [Marinobacterium iners]